MTVTDDDKQEACDRARTTWHYALKPLAQACAELREAKEKLEAAEAFKAEVNRIVREIATSLEGPLVYDGGLIAKKLRSLMLPDPEPDLWEQLATFQGIQQVSSDWLKQSAARLNLELRRKDDSNG